MGEEKSYRIWSGKEMVDSPVPTTRFRVQGLLRARGGRMSITAPLKQEKSILAHDLGLKIAAGDTWLGYGTTMGRVLYVNLEIARPMFQQRTQDFQAQLQYDDETLERFKSVTILDHNLKLDSSIKKVQLILNSCKVEGFEVDVLILDPRARLVAGNENEGKVINDFCENIDKLINKNSRLSVIIVTHMGKNWSKGAIGHSRFSGWLDSEIQVTRTSGIAGRKSVEITARYGDSASFSIDFSYPIHRLIPEDEMARKVKVNTAKKFILKKLIYDTISEQDLRNDARKHNITEYAFQTAIRELKSQNTIETLPAGGKGNRKLLKLVEDEN
jgi:hypothetical protein